MCLYRYYFTLIHRERTQTSLFLTLYFLQLRCEKSLVVEWLLLSSRGVVFFLNFFKFRAVTKIFVSANNVAMINRTKKSKVPVFKKYAKINVGIDARSKLKPSAFSQSIVDIKCEDYPMIIEFVNLFENTCQIHSTVELDQPLFNPSPNVVIFEDYGAFTIHQTVIYFRNNDSVARRMKIMQPDSPYFEVSAPKSSSGDFLKASKVASGMEISYVITFKPQEARDYSFDLVCATEREKFIVPIRAVEKKPQMTFPDEIHFGECVFLSSI